MATLFVVDSTEEKMSTNGYGHGMARAASHAGTMTATFIDSKLAF